MLASGAPAAIWRLLESLPTPRRNLIIENLRLQQIYDAIYAVALDSALRHDAGRGVCDLVRTRVCSASRSRDIDVGPEPASGSCSSSSARPT